MTSSHSYRRQIDACRPGSNDLQLPELADLARAVASDPHVAQALDAAHATDVALCDGLQDVAVPSGLAERMLAAVGAPSRPLLSVVEEATSAAPASDLAPSQPAVAAVDRRPTSRRVWLAALPALAALLLAAVGISLWPSSQPRKINKEQLAQQVNDWYQQTEAARGWQVQIDANREDRFPIPGSIAAKPARQRTIQIVGAAEGVAYELNRSGQRAVLLVVRTRDQYGVQALPYTQLKTATGNKAVAAWQSGPLLYVLVVEGDGRRLGDFVRPPSLT